MAHVLASPTDTWQHKHCGCLPLSQCIAFSLSNAALVPTCALPIRPAVGPVYPNPASRFQSSPSSRHLPLVIMMLTAITIWRASRCRPCARALVRSPGRRQIRRARGRPAAPGQAAYLVFAPGGRSTRTPFHLHLHRKAVPAPANHLTHNLASRHPTNAKLSRRPSPAPRRWPPLPPPPALGCSPGPPVCDRARRSAVREHESAVG